MDGAPESAGRSTLTAAEHLLEPEPEQSCFGDGALRAGSGSTLSCSKIPSAPELFIRSFPPGLDLESVGDATSGACRTTCGSGNWPAKGDREHHGTRGTRSGDRLCDRATT
jgi:hypothetical protein